MQTWVGILFPIIQYEPTLERLKLLTKHERQSSPIEDLLIA